MKAFSLLEVIIVILVISIIYSFSVSKFSFFDKNKNLIKVKSDFVFIQHSLQNYKQKKILLGKKEDIDSLDDAHILKKDEKLFSKILDKNIISSDNIQKKLGSWIKTSNNTYEFLLANSKTIKFKLKDGFFSCVSSVEICKELE
ncbi:MAG: prepilin-type N-terminal cleavage/methylation domain-containing protein [Arcobacter sp.]|nr:prepilin-type N-terminal cleavage/methylation domain-containing protein [Arcobacter sp.]